MTATEFPDFGEMRNALRAFNERSVRSNGPACSEASCGGTLRWDGGRVVCDACDLVGTSDG